MSNEKEPGTPKIEDLPSGVEELTPEEAAQVDGGAMARRFTKTTTTTTTLSSGGPQDVGDRPDDA